MFYCLLLPIYIRGRQFKRFVKTCQLKAGYTTAAGNCDLPSIIQREVRDAGKELKELNIDQLAHGAWAALARAFGQVDHRHLGVTIHARNVTLVDVDQPARLLDEFNRIGRRQNEM